MVLGLKNIPHDLVYLSNDDIETPAAMAGKKVVPILELGEPGTETHEVRILYHVASTAMGGWMGGWPGGWLWAAGYWVGG